jgi:serine/threonine protein kinase
VTSSLRLLRPLGRGGMGVLWIAEHRALGNEVVVKFLSDELADDPSAAKRIAGEAAAAARVKSPHVVQILDHGVSGGTPFIVMELLEGCDLRAYLETRGALSHEETTTIVYQLAKALGKTHAAGIVHRDVKPSNIFLCDGDGEIFVKLLDFGLAQRSLSGEPSTTGSRRCAGTPPYMSPEQIIGTAVDARCDVWALGAVAFQCLTGKRPFEGETLGAVALAIHTLPLPRATDLKPELPVEVNGWFARACARSREERFASAIEAAEAMARALGLVLPATHASRPIDGAAQDDRTISGDFTLTRGGAARLAQRRRASRVWIASLAVALATVAAAAGAYRAGSQPNRPAATRSPDTEPPAMHAEAINALERMGAGEAAPESTVALHTESPSPPARISPKQMTQTASSGGKTPVAAGSAVPGSSAAADPSDKNRRPIRSHELPDERY